MFLINWSNIIRMFLVVSISSVRNITRSRDKQSMKKDWITKTPWAKLWQKLKRILKVSLNIMTWLGKLTSFLLSKTREKKVMLSMTSGKGDIDYPFYINIYKIWDKHKNHLLIKIFHLWLLNIFYYLYASISMSFNWPDIRTYPKLFYNYQTYQSSILRMLHSETGMNEMKTNLSRSQTINYDYLYFLSHRVLFLYFRPPFC